MKTETMINKICGCGMLFEHIPANAKYSDCPDLGGYYWNCSKCATTLYEPSPEARQKAVVSEYMSKIKARLDEKASERERLEAESDRLARLQFILDFAQALMIGGLVWLGTKEITLGVAAFSTISLLYRRKP